MAGKMETATCFLHTEIEEQMGISYQRGWVRPRGKKWHGCFRRMELDSATNEPKLITASIVLGLRTEMSKSQARERLEDELAKLGGRSSGDQVVPNGSVTFEWFVKNRRQILENVRLAPEKLIPAAELIAIGIKPGPILGKILNELYELQLDGKLKTREQATAYLREILRRDNIQE